MFVVRDGRVATPPKSPYILAGVTRDLLLEVIREAGYVMAEEQLTRADLAAADEIWLTSSSRDLVCVNVLDGRMVGDGRTYGVAATVLAAFQASRQRRLSTAQADATFE